MYTLEQLSDLEEIKELKSKYCRLGDTKQWEEWVQLFTEDYEAEMNGVPRFTKNDPTSVKQIGVQNVVELWSVALKGIQTRHTAVNPEITLTSPTTAKGIWSLHDILYMPTNRFEGWGHYHEDYVKVQGRWKIKKVVTTRLRTDEHWYDDK
jgi:hypothetical protein